MKRLINLMESVVPKENLVEYHVMENVGLLYSTVRLTPALASKWRVRAHDKQRRLRVGNLFKLTSIVEKSEWDSSNGENLKFDNNGVFIDGNHRCCVVENTGKPIICQVVFGCGNQSFANIDTGAARTSSNTLEVMGIENANALAAIAKKTISFQRSGSFQLSIPNIEIAKFVEKNHEEIQFALSCARKGAPLIQMSVGGCLSYQYSMVNRNLTLDFFNDFKNMAATSSNAASILYRTLSQQTLKSNKVRINIVWLTAVCIKAMNLYFRGGDTKQLKWSKQEKFPEITTKCLHT